MVLNFGDADSTQKATGATSPHIDFVCVICTSNNSSTADVASLSLPLSLSVSLFKNTSHINIASSLPALSFFRSYNEVFVQTAFIPYYLSTDVDFVCVLCTSSSTPAVASPSLPLSLCVSLFKNTSHNNIASSLPALSFFRSYNEVFVQTAFIPYYLSTDIDFVCVLCTSVLLLLLPLLLSLYLSVSLFKNTSHSNIASSLPALSFFRSYNEVFVQTAFIPYYLSIDIDFVCVLCTSSSTPAVASLSLPLSLSTSSFKGTPPNIAISLPTLLFFRSYNEVFVQGHLFPTSLLARTIFRFVTTGLILCTPLYVTN